MNAVLALFSQAYCLATRAKNIFYDRGWLRPRRAPMPVVSVGSLAMGGMGKTPLAMEILDRMISGGVRAALVTRGYRGSWERRGGVLWEGGRVYGDWKKAGDEPSLVARRFPQAGVFVGRHRYASCLKARALGFELAVLDDGFQHRKLHRDLDIVLYDPAAKTARREPLAALKRAHIILIPEGVRKEFLKDISGRFPAAKVMRFSVIPRAFHRIGRAGAEKTIGLRHFRGSRALAFCGIARPERFFSLLEGLGLRLLERMAFPDHHPYPLSSWRRIAERVGALKPEVVLTTEKDEVKLIDRPGFSAAQKIPGDSPLFYVLQIGLSLEPRFHQAVDSALKSRKTKRK